MSVGLFVEGESDRKAISIIVRKVLETQGRPRKLHCRNLRGRGDMFEARKIRAHLEQVLKQHPEVSKVVVCVDSHCTDPAEIQEKASRVEQELEKMDLPVVPRYAIVVHALEGWLASDAEAVGWILRVETLPSLPRNLEEECKPAKLLERLFRRHGRSFVKTRDDPKIACHVNSEEIARHSPSFRQFCQLIKDP